MKSTVLDRKPYALKVQLQLGAEDLAPMPAAPDTAWVTEQMRAGVRAFLQEKGFRPCKAPALKLLNRSSQGLSFVCEMELFPPVKLPHSLQAQVDVPALEPPMPAELSKAVEDLQLKLADLHPVERPAQWGDLLILDWVGTCQNRLIPLSPQYRWQVVLAPAANDDPVLSQLIGLSAGSEKTLAYTLPEDYPLPAWRKAPAQAQVYVHQVIEVRVPPTDDVLAQASGEADTFDELLQVLYDQVAEQKRLSWLAQVRETVSQHVVQAAQVPIPPEWELAELRACWENSDARMLARFEHFAQAPALLAQGWQSWQAHTHLRRQQAEALKTRLVLQEVALQQGVFLSAEQRETALAAVAEGLQLTPAELNQALAEDATRTTVEGQLVLDQVVRWLVSQAHISSDGQRLS